MREGDRASSASTSALLAASLILSDPVVAISISISVPILAPTRMRAPGLFISLFRMTRISSDSESRNAASLICCFSWSVYISPAGTPNPLAR